MLPLLSYKLYRYKKGLTTKSENKSKVSNCTNNQCNVLNQRKRSKSPTIMEITILLLGMFGVPLFYFCYWNLIYFYHWAITNETENLTNTITKSLTFEHDNNPFDFDPVSISIKDIIEIRLKNMKKYKFNYSWTDIDRRSDLSLEEYRDMYSGKWPVIITDCGTKWPAIKKWNIEYFTKNFGKDLVTVKTMADGVAETFAMPFGIYLKNLHSGFPNLWTYLNDEMFIPSRPILQRDIGSCNEINEDFFRLFPTEVRPWWSFLLWGTRYSRSQLHMDPFNWTGTNMVISGLKQWKLFPPGQDHFLHVIIEQKYKFPINSYKYNSEIDCFNPSSMHKYPSLKSAKVIEFYQYPGELLIIPTGWFHQAFNEEVTLAISGQLMNSENYLHILEEIFKGGDLPRGPYNSSTRNKLPKEQVKQVLSRITEKTLQQGREATQFIYNQLKQLAESSGLPTPPSILDATKPYIKYKNDKN